MPNEKVKAIVDLGGGCEFDLASQRWQDQGFRCFVTGMSGSGKTNLVALWLEEAHRLGLQFVVIDPSGDYASLSSLGGVAVCGGGRSVKNDYPEVGWLDVVMQRIGAGSSLVLELDRDGRGRRFGTVDKRIMFTWFVNRFLDYQMVTRKPVFLVFEEAQIFAPQKNNGGQDVAAWEAFQEVVRRGRREGVLLLMASQRPRDLEADIATQCNLTFIGHMEHRLDFNQVRDTLFVPSSNSKRPPPRGMNGKRTVVAESPGMLDVCDLEAGQFYVRIGKRLHLVKVRQRKTKHLGKTPAIQLNLLEV